MYRNKGRTNAVLVGMVLAVALLLGGFSKSEAASAKSDYPAKPIRMIVNFAAGGAVDLTARALTSVSGSYFNQPLIVELKPGSGGALGATFVSKAAPDGYTILLSSYAPMTVFPLDEKDKGIPQVTYKREDFEPICLVNYDPMIVSANPKTGFKTLADMIDYAKKNPGKLVFSTSGIWGNIHIPLQMLSEQAGIKMTHMPTTGGGPAQTALLNGDAMISAPVASVGVGHVKEGLITALASSSATPYAPLPKVPTLKSLGYDIDFEHWIAVFVPKGTPSHVKAYLTKKFEEISNDPSYKKVSERMGTIVKFMPGAEFQKKWDADFELAKKIISGGK